MLVPLVNFVMLLVFAFSKWPVLTELEILRGANAGPWGAAGPAPGSTGWSPAGTANGRSPPGAGDRSGSGPGDTPISVSVGLPPSALGARAPEEVGPPLPSFWGFQPDAPEHASESGAHGAAPGGSAGDGIASAPAGWYPTGDGRRRYWDGRAWTDHFA